ncbi:MAG TPA: hypothetical protein VF771_02480 [Longimicrobiaceae bacterium]
MLTLTAYLAGACFAALDTTPPTMLGAAHIGRQEDRVVMADTLPFGNRFGFPFTREEYKRSLRQVLPEAEAEAQTGVIYDPDPEATGFGIADTNLLWLAALSDDVAQRVIAFRPRLRDEVLRVRQDPQAFIAAFRSGPSPP